jgi:DNA-3-methyladenine glycosylase
MSAAAAAPLAGRSSPDRRWFDRPAVEVAAELLGMTLISDRQDGRVAGRILEVEAYEGPEDLAAHSSRGRTRRNEVMFGPPGNLYVYLVYGLHLCANVVCGPGAKPEAVLLRAAEVTEGVEIARRRRGPVPERRLAAGPGNLGSAFGIERSLNGADLLSGPVRLAFGEPAGRVRRTPRIGVAYAGAWADAPLRFVIDDDHHRTRA